MTPGVVQEPLITLPPKVRDYVTREFRAARTILEYGSGGSTVIAAMSGARIFSVESDPDWARNVETWLAAKGLKDKVTLHLADIGPTKLWGRPKKIRLVHLPRYLRYPSSVWLRADFQHPDVILIDGRFRVACFLEAMTRIRRPTRLLFDDYVRRQNYHVVERFQKPVQTIDRMAVFDLEPRRLEAPEWVGTISHRLRAH
jgi:hypothetical protein